MDIPFFRYSHLFGPHRAEILAALESVMDRGAFILQAEVAEFESKIAGLVGVKHAIGTGNATDALELIFRAIGLGSGDEVIVPSHTFVATVAAIRNSGGTPVLADCADDHLLDIGKVERLISSRTKAIVPVQLNGRVCDMERLGEIARRHNVLIVEDSSQALGRNFAGERQAASGSVEYSASIRRRILDVLVTEE